MTIRRSSFETTDLDEACHLMSTAYAEGNLRIAATDADGLRLAQTRHDCGPVFLDSYTNTLALDFQVKLDDVIVLARMADGVMDIDDHHDPFAVGRGDLFAVTARRPYRAITTGTAMTMVGIEVSLLAELAEESADRLGARLEHHRVHPDRAQAWNATVAPVTAVLTEPRGEVGQLLVDGANRILAAAMLAALLPEPDATPADRTDAHPGTLRRATAYIESNPDLPLTVIDIARAVAVTPRALQLAFRRHLDTTPMAYLRQVRLER